MTDGHERYQQLAVGHVLGGLDAQDAAAFRGHLLGCRDCRLRVAELRGIASDLEAAERDERARSLVTTEVREVSEDEPLAAASASRITRRHVTVASLLIVLLAGAMGFWNLHLRTSNQMTSEVIQQQEDSLHILADGVPTEVETTHPVRATAAVDGERVALAVVGLPTLEAGQRLVVWLVGPEGAKPVRVVAAEHMGDGVGAFAIEVEDAGELLLTVERGQLGTPTDGAELAQVALDADEHTSEP